MFSKVLFTLFMFTLGLYTEVSAVKCYSCEAVDKHLPMSDCYFIANTTSFTTCPSSCLFFQYIALQQEYNYYDTIEKRNTTVKGDIAHTVRSCAPSNRSEACIVNSTASVTRHCIVCKSDLCNESSSKTVPAMTTLLVLVLVSPLCLPGI